MQDAAKSFGQDAKNADLRLVDDRLLEAERSGEVAPGADPLHPEEVSRFVRQVTRVRLEAPSSQRRERDPFDMALAAPGAARSASGERRRRRRNGLPRTGPRPGIRAGPRSRLAAPRSWDG